AQDKSNRGKEFWLAYGFDYSFFHESPVNNQELLLYISAVDAATVTITISNTAYSQTINIPANTVNATVTIPKSGVNDARTLTDGLQNRNIHIVSTEPVAVYAHVYSTMVSGATMLMPVETYGYTYRSINYYQTTSGSSPDDWYSWFYVVASEDNTRLNITPSDTTKNGWLPNQTYTINLNKGESYHVFGKAVFDGNPVNASKDMTGSKVVSVAGSDGLCHPVAMFSGSGGIRLCPGDGGEFIHQQVFPTQAWGTRYLTYHTINNTNTNITETNRNYYRICVLDPTTVVKKNGVTMTGLLKNFFYEHMDSTGGDYFTADKPIMVSQYTPNKNQCWNFPTTTPSPPSYGDPEMFYLSPIEQGQKSVLFYASRRSSIDYVYVNIHLPTAAISSLRVDGNPLPAVQITPHPNYPSYSVALARFTGAAAQHSIVSDSAFTATVYGLGNYESYGYNVGTLVNNLNNYGVLANVNNTNGQVDTFTCKNTPLRLFVKLAYPALSIHWKLSTVPGISPNADSIITNPVPVGTEIINGRTYYLYTLQQDFTFANTGTFYLPVSFTAAVIENCSQTENASIKIVVNEGPVASFNYSSALCLSDTIQFTGNSNAAGFNLNAYEWLFDDGSTALTQNSSKRFSTDGPHPVRYRIIADNGCMDDTIRTVAILPQPVAKFGIAASICNSDSVYITDTSLVAGGNISSWQWNFGDGNTEVRSSGNPFYHKYAMAGPYVISLIVTSNSGCKSDTLTKSINVLPAPRAKFGYDRNVCLGQSIQFSDSSLPAGGAITQWHWNYGDGNSQIRTNNSNFNYSYTAVGTYVVSLIVNGANNCKSDSFKLTVNVTSKPSADFTYNGKACIDSVFSFSSATVFNNAVPSTWYWAYGDGQTSTIGNTHTAAHQYQAAASSVRVRHAVSFGGCASDTTEQVIPVIYRNPSASFSIDDATICENEQVVFSGSGSADISKWNWDFGNAVGNNIPPFNRLYSNAGNYNVTLTVENAGGCKAVIAPQLINVAAAPDVSAGPDIFIRPGQTSSIAASINNPSAYNFLWTPPNALSSSNVLNPVTSAVNDVLYKITATHKLNGCVDTDSVWVKMVTNIFVPNAFTPNNDGLHDVWRIPALAGYPRSTVTIYNRYSQKIYEATGNSRPWDGTFKGAPQPIGAYVYIIQPGEPGMDLIKGTVTIIR
ncbi:MAG: PKD domain-containing protein, partial [Sphingobacteriales bacterium]